MNILFDINHPADIHFFKNTINHLKSNGHQVVITARDKDVIIDLLERLNYSYIKLSTAKPGLLNLGLELIKKDLLLLPIFFKYKIDVAVAFTGTCISHVGWLLRKPRLVFYDNDEAKLQNLITYPFASHIYTPECYPDDLGKKHERFKGIKELAYLHPDYFKPDKSIYTDLGINDSDRYIIIRKVAWGAAHDVGQTGLSKENVLELIEMFSDEYKIFISSEGEVDSDLQPYLIPIDSDKIHHALFYAEAFIGEGATMACECACLGTPAIYINTLNPSHVVELEKAEMIFYFKDGSSVINEAKKLLSHSTTEDWKGKAKQYIDSKEDVNEFIKNKIFSTFS